MVNYRRNRALGGHYFLTLTLKDRKASYLTDNIDLLRDSFRNCRRTIPFFIKAIVILPEHLHCIIALPPNENNYSEIIRKIKAHFTKGLVKQGVTFNKTTNGQYDYWQRRFWEHTIRNERDLTTHINYIHYNPVKHGLVSTVREWPYSSFHRYVERGLIEPDWGENLSFMPVESFGE